MDNYRYKNISAYTLSKCMTKKGQQTLEGNVTTTGGLFNGATATEMSYLSGTKRKVQDQIDELTESTGTTQQTYQPLGEYMTRGGQQALTSNVTATNDTYSFMGAKPSEITKLSGTTSNIQNQFATVQSNLNTKMTLGGIQNFTANITAANDTYTFLGSKPSEIAQLSGIYGNVQSLLDTKLSKGGQQALTENITAENDTYTFMGAKPSEIAHLEGVSDKIQTQLDTKMSKGGQQALTENITAENDTYTFMGAKPSEIAHLEGVSDKIQTQLDARMTKGGQQTLTSNMTAANDTYSFMGAKPSEIAKLSGVNNNIQSKLDSISNKADDAKTSASNAQGTADSAQSTANSAQTTANAANTLAGTANSAAIAANALAGTANAAAAAANTLASSANTTANNALPKSGGTLTGNLNGITPTQLGYLTSLSGNVQSNLNNKADTSQLNSYLPLTGGTLTSTLTANGGLICNNAAAPQVTITNPNAASISRLLFMNGSSTSGGYLGINTVNEVVLVNGDASGIGFSTNATRRLTIQSNGNVGIGTMVPNTALDVNGTFNVSGDTTLSGTLNGLNGNFSSLKVNNNDVLAPSIITYSWIATASTASTITLANLFGTSIPARGTFHYHIYPTIVSNNAATGIIVIENSLIAGALTTNSGAGITVTFTAYTSSFTASPSATWVAGRELNIRLMKLF